MMEEPIKLNGLLESDIPLLRSMWAIESLDDFVLWTLSLTPTQMARVKYLTSRIVEALDIEAEGEIEDTSDAASVLKKFTLG